MRHKYIENDLRLKGDAVGEVIGGYSLKTMVFPLPPN